MSGLCVFSQIVRPGITPLERKVDYFTTLSCGNRQVLLSPKRKDSDTNFLPNQCGVKAHISFQSRIKRLNLLVQKSIWKPSFALQSCNLFFQFVFVSIAAKLKLTDLSA